MPATTVAGEKVIALRPWLNQPPPFSRTMSQPSRYAPGRCGARTWAASVSASCGLIVRGSGVRSPSKSMRRRLAASYQW
ncbi:hypothetical protein HC891_27150 [Candidatus Gracilibacteria bacterium]|nr:hypothetical protein [Candidatus Gracilibacteria bacterium]